MNPRKAFLARQRAELAAAPAATVRLSNRAFCAQFAGKTLRHRHTGQVRSVALWEDRVWFRQDGAGTLERSFAAAAKWLRHADVLPAIAAEPPTPQDVAVAEDPRA